MTFTISNVKLELGTHETPWVPNQADLVGPAAGFGTPTATINNSTGTPSVTVTASGSNTAKVFNFAFSNLKGAKGDTGSVNWADMTTANKQELINAVVTIVENDIGSTDSMQF